MHKEIPDVGFEDFDTAEFGRPVLYIERLELVQKPSKPFETSMKVFFSDGSEEMHKSVDSLAIRALQQWMVEKVPLHRFDTGTLMEADLSIKDHQTRMLDFFKLVFGERTYTANKFAQGNQSKLDQIDDEKNGIADFVVYITHYASTWYTHFPPHGRDALLNFQKAMVKVANLAYSAHSWANRRVAALEIEAQARAVAASRADTEE